MNELKIFENPEFGSVRTVEIDGEPWFVGKDVATALGYANTADAIQKHVDNDDKLESQIAISGQNRKIIVINESGLYSLVLSSKLPSAKKFKKWVTSEVLPSIRKHGMYAEKELLDNPDLLIKVAQALKEEREKIQRERPKVVKVSGIETKKKEKAVVIEPEEEVYPEREDELLEDIGRIPDDLHSHIQKEQDKKRLKEWCRLAAHVKSVEEFQEKYQDI